MTTAWRARQTLRVYTKLGKRLRDANSTRRPVIKVRCGSKTLFIVTTTPHPIEVGIVNGNVGFLIPRSSK